MGGFLPRLQLQPALRECGGSHQVPRLLLRQRQPARRSPCLPVELLARGAQPRFKGDTVQGKSFQKFPPIKRQRLRQTADFSFIERLLFILTG